MLACDSPRRVRSWDPVAPGRETKRLMREAGGSERYLTVKQDLLSRRSRNNVTRLSVICKLLLQF